MSTRPTWPSLYSWDIEVFPIEAGDPVQPDAVYLHNHNDVFRFTLYWTLVFYTPAFILAASYAFLNLTFPPARVPRRGPRTRSSNTQAQAALAQRYRALFKPNERRSRWAFALLVFLGFTTFAVAGAVIGSAIIGYVMAALFEAGKYNMSTWVPFLAGLLQTLVGFLGLWPSVVDII
ncbi:hypothetical protein FOMPIDRAFT_47671 [Fomitopsis schrenkii]|uniref:Integral membrane protein n=1 Tax=Fomitopsis schrenkii TaxID=2126942 RepID=S8EIE1_FOMSC|nr:hypothetical protein FOMPIDRAFT_47671 [Fomitopsis schrenkii]